MILGGWRDINIQELTTDVKLNWSELNSVRERANLKCLPNLETHHLHPLLHAQFTESDSHACDSALSIIRLRTGQNGLNHHLLTNSRLGQSEICPCYTSSTTTEHLLLCRHAHYLTTSGASSSRGRLRWRGSVSAVWTTCSARQPSYRGPEFPSGWSIRRRRSNDMDLENASSCFAKLLWSRNKVKVMLRLHKIERSRLSSVWWKAYHKVFVES